VKIIFRFFLILFLTVLMPVVFSCSFIPGQDFYVTRVSLEENGIIGTKKEQIEIEFSNQVDEKSVKDNIKIEEDNGAEIAFQHRVSKERIILTPEEEWEPLHRFWLVVSGELKDIRGKTLGRDFYLPFQSTEGLLPVSGIMVLPVVSGGIVEQETKFLKIGFSSDVDKNSVERAFSISPCVKGYFEWLDSSSFTYHLIDSFQKNTLYTVSISDEARDAEGYKLKPFTEDFEYYPNFPYPEVTAIYAGAQKIYDPSDSLSFSIEDGKILVIQQEVENNIALRFDFSDSVDVLSFRDSFSVSPHAGWYEKWNIEGTAVNIYFEDNLNLEEKYELHLKKGVKSRDGVEFCFEYLLLLEVNGPYSRFIEFYAPVFTDLDLEMQDVELWESGTLIDNGVEGVTLCGPLDNQGEGYALKVNYNESLIQEQDLPLIEIRWDILLGFTHPFYVPVIEKGSLQDAVSLIHIFGNSSFSGSIHSFSWEADNICILNIREMGAGCIYHLSMEGGKTGVVDELENYMKEDVEFFFRVILSPE